MEYGGWQQQQGAGADGAPRLRPLDIGQKIDAAIKLTTRNFGTLARIVLLVALPVQVITVLVTLSTLPDNYKVGGFGGTASPDSSVNVPTGYWVGQVVVSLLGILVYLLINAACFRAIGHAYLGGRTTWQESLRFALKRLPSVLWVVFLFYGAVVLGIFTLGIVSVYCAVAFSLALPVLLLEDQRGTKALGRSRSLIAGRWWRTFGLLLAGYVLASVIAGLVQGVLAAVLLVAVGDHSAIAVVLSGVAGLAGQVITTPFFAALVTVLYFDLRIRKEAFDLQVLAQGMGGQAPTAATPTQSMPWFAPPTWGGGQPAYGQPGQPQGWGQPQQQWGQPGPPPPAWGQPQQQQWGQPGQPPASGQPQQQPTAPAAPPAETQQWGQPPAPPPQNWEPPAPPQDPPPPPQQWEPPTPPGPPAPPDPPDRSST